MDLAETSRSAARVAAPLLAVFAACGAPTPDNTPASDPRGHDASFHFSWRIDGLAPSDASDPCTTAGIRFVRMNVVDANDTAYPIDTFRFDCHLGSYISAAPELRAGTYRIFWEALGADGARRSVAAGVLANGTIDPALEVLNVPTSGLVDFDLRNRPSADFPGAPTNFATGRGSLRTTFAWAAHAGDTSGPDCNTANVATITWTLRRSNHAVVDARTAPARCADGFNAVQWDELDFDEYGLDLNGFDAAGQPAYRGHCEPMPLRAGGASPARVTCVADPIP